MFFASSKHTPSCRELTILNCIFVAQPYAESQMIKHYCMKCNHTCVWEDMYTILSRVKHQSPIVVMLLARFTTVRASVKILHYCSNESVLTITYAVTALNYNLYSDRGELEIGKHMIFCDGNKLSWLCYSTMSYNSFQCLPFKDWRLQSNRSNPSKVPVSNRNNTNCCIVFSLPYNWIYVVPWLH